MPPRHSGFDGSADFEIHQEATRTLPNVNKDTPTIETRGLGKRDAKQCGTRDPRIIELSLRVSPRDALGETDLRRTLYGVLLRITRLHSRHRRKFDTRDCVRIAQILEDPPLQRYPVSSPFSLIFSHIPFHSLFRHVHPD